MEIPIVEEAGQGEDLATTGPLSPVDALLIQTTRCYDALMLLLKHFDPQEAQWLADYHEAGGILSPNPAIFVENDAAVLGTNGELDGTDPGSP